MKNANQNFSLKIFRLVALLFTGMIVLAACDFPGTIDRAELVATYAAQTLQANDREQTLAAYETLAAGLTETALVTGTFTPTPTPTATETPTSSPTATSVPPTLTATPVPATSTPTATKTAIPPTPTRTPTVTPTKVRCNWAEFVKDVTVPDGTVMTPGETFTKVWRLKNIGSCTWSTDYDLVHVSGPVFSAAKRMGLQEQVLPGETIDIAVLMEAPTYPGNYTSYWKLADKSGKRFGLGEKAEKNFWVNISVEPSTTIAYSFAENFCDATWYGGLINPIPCPGKETDREIGYVVYKQRPIRENGGIENEPGIVTSPNKAKDGYIVGTFPEILIQKGDLFSAVIGCQYDSPGCDVTFELLYRIGDGKMYPLGSWRETYDGRTNSVVVDLSGLSGHKVSLILRVKNNGTARNNRALWIYPRILR